jgi:hypothetical protein
LSPGRLQVWTTILNAKSFQSFLKGFNSEFLWRRITNIHRLKLQKCKKYYKTKDNFVRSLCTKLVIRQHKFRFISQLNINNQIKDQSYLLQVIFYRLNNFWLHIWSPEEDLSTERKVSAINKLVFHLFSRIKEFKFW